MKKLFKILQTQITVAAFIGILFPSLVAAAPVNPAHLIIIGTVSNVMLNTDTIKNPGSTTVFNRMGSVYVTGSGFKARKVNTTSGAWSDAEAVPSSSGNILFPLGFLGPADPPQRSGFAFACMQLALAAKAKGKRFMYGSNPACRQITFGPPDAYAWELNTFDSNVANSGGFTQTQDYQVIGAEYYTLTAGPPPIYRTSYSSLGDFCAYEFDSGTYKWLAVSATGMSIFITNAGGDLSVASQDCGLGSGKDTKTLPLIYPGASPVFMESNISKPLVSGTWDYWYNATTNYILSGRMSPAYWGCFNQILERFKTGTSFTTATIGCLLVP